MTGSGYPYHSLITPRSRRIRTVGLVLLAATLLMSLYGAFVLMPRVVRTVATSPASAPTRITRPLTPAERHEQRARQLVVTTALAYWGVCSLLLVSALVAAWLDVRETTRAFAGEQATLVRDAAEGLRRARAEQLARRASEASDGDKTQSMDPPS